LLLSEIVTAFACKFSAMAESFSETNVQDVFDVFLQSEHLSEFENILTLAVNLATEEAYDDGINEEDTEAGVLNGPFEKLSNDDRVKAVKAFLTALADAHNDITNIRPFIKQKIGPDYLGNDFGEKVKVRSNRYGPAEEAIDESVSRKHFKATADIIRAIENPQKRQKWADHHASQFASQNPRFNAAKFHRAAGTKYSGSKLVKEGNALHNLPITEQLLSPQSISKVQRYADYLEKYPNYFKPLDDSGAEDLKAAGKMRQEHDEKFSNGSAEYDPSDFMFGRTRTNKGKR